jgi:hypothetical protein
MLATECVLGQCIKSTMELVGSLRSGRISTTEMGGLTINFIRKTVTIYGSTALVDPGLFFSYLIHTQSAGLLQRWISPS